MQITDVQPIKPPTLVETNGTCTVCHGHQATLRVTVDNVVSFRTCKHCVQLNPEHMFYLMKRRG